MCSATSQRKKKKRLAPALTASLSPKGDICNVLALQASAGKGGQHTPESRWCPARDTPALLPAHGLKGHEVLLVTSTLEKDTMYCPSSLADKKCWLTRAPVDTEKYCWPWYNELENSCVLMKKRKGKNPIISPAVVSLAGLLQAPSHNVVSVSPTTRQFELFLFPISMSCPMLQLHTHTPTHPPLSLPAEPGLELTELQGHSIPLPAPARTGLLSPGQPGRAIPGLWCPGSCSMPAARPAQQQVFAWVQVDEPRLHPW